MSLADHFGAFLESANLSQQDIQSLGMYHVYIPEQPTLLASHPA
jgi:hypothetical protein